MSATCIVKLQYIFFIMSTDIPHEKRTVKYTLNVTLWRYSIVWIILVLGGKALHLLCSDNIAMLKWYNIHHHSQTKHSSQYSQLTENSMVRKYYKTKTDYLITEEFLHRCKKKKKGKWACNQSEFVSGSFVSQARKVIYQC